MRVPIHSPEEAPEGSRDALKGLTERLGGTLNIFGAMAESPALLNAYAGMEQALRDHSGLGEKTRQAIHLRISRLNDCDYCRAAYRAACEQAGWSAEEIAAIATGDADFDVQLDALLGFVTALVQDEGWVDDTTWEAAKDAGWTDRELLDAYAEVPRTIMTNWFNHMMDTPLDDMLKG